jgi:chemotaxis protein histidine kinase CheA
VTKNFATDAVNARRVGGYGFISRLAHVIWWDLMAIALSGTLFVSFIFAQDRTALTLNQVSDLLKQGISSSRIAQLVEQYGVAFELNDAASKRLRQDGADEVVLSAVKRMAARYTEEQQRRKRSETEEKRREQEEAQRRAERKRQEEQAKQKELEKKGTKKPEDTAQGADDIRKRLQEEARRKEEERRKEEQRQSTAAPKETQEAPRKPDEPRVPLPFDQPPKAQEEAKQGSQKGPGPALRTPEDAERVASLRNVTSTPEGEVSGEIVNNSKQTVRDVRLQILYSWRWKNETRPGKDDPGTVNYHSLNQEIPPGKTTRFNYKPSPPLPSRTDGQFDITVKIIGFAEIFPGVRK